jgi:stage V sporulation protein S
MDLMKLKVAGGSNPKSVAGSIANNIREKKDIEITVMGPNAVNCAMKAIAIAREFIAADNMDLVCRPEFTHLELDGEQKSAMKIIIMATEKK